MSLSNLLVDRFYIWKRVSQQELLNGFFSANYCFRNNVPEHSCMPGVTVANTCKLHHPYLVHCKYSFGLPYYITIIDATSKGNCISGNPKVVIPLYTVFYSVLG